MTKHQSKDTIFLSKGWMFSTTYRGGGWGEDKPEDGKVKIVNSIAKPNNEIFEPTWHLIWGQRPFKVFSVRCVIVSLTLSWGVC